MGIYLYSTLLYDLPIARLVQMRCRGGGREGGRGTDMNRIVKGNFWSPVLSSLNFPFSLSGAQRGPTPPPLRSAPLTPHMQAQNTLPPSPPSLLQSGLKTFVRFDMGSRPAGSTVVQYLEYCT